MAKYTDLDKRYRAEEMFRRAERRARDLSLPFDLTLEYVLSLCVDKCPVLSIPLDYSSWRSRRGQGRKGNIPCIDRQVPFLGYKTTNVWIISCSANARKGPRVFTSLEELHAWIEFERADPYMIHRPKW